MKRKVCLKKKKAVQLLEKKIRLDLKNAEQFKKRYPRLFTRVLAEKPYFWFAFRPLSNPIRIKGKNLRLEHLQKEKQKKGKLKKEEEKELKLLLNLKEMEESYRK